MHIEGLAHETAPGDPSCSDDATGFGVRTIDHPAVVLARTDPSVAPIATMTTAHASSSRRIRCPLECSRSVARGTTQCRARGRARLTDAMPRAGRVHVAKGCGNRVE